MLRLRSRILAHLLFSPATSPHRSPHPAASHSTLRRLLLSAAVPPRTGFAVHEYLVETCGLTEAQALKASAKLSHLKSPSKPDAVPAFLAGLGLSTADIAAVVPRDPRFLCAGVERTLAPNVLGLAGLGLSRSQIARLVSLVPGEFRRRSIVSNLPYYQSLFGSYENLLRVLNRNNSLLGCSLDKVVKPNVAFLRECGLGDCDITKLCCKNTGILSNNPERVQAMAARAEGLGVPRSSGMFREALMAVATMSQEMIAAKVNYLKNTFRWSEAEVSIAVHRSPMVLVRSKNMLQSKSEFLISEVRLEPVNIAHRPVMLGLSLEGRLRPRHYVMRFLKANGLLDCDRSYFSAVMVTEKLSAIVCLVHVNFMLLIVDETDNMIVSPSFNAQYYDRRLTSLVLNETQMNFHGYGWTVAKGAGPREGRVESGVAS
ncbi:uncharacterized protein [Aegilops tauschii subsp. strangulata]|uniref:uncharacterized protein n=1 Tax=Aegilops tauschii subsp. strangulata TaxID=200361 RepID=UPI001ABCF535|nr:uncharacterized protein LOC120961894 [Aegilops tauschii subsp. strangulata]